LLQLIELFFLHQYKEQFYPYYSSIKKKGGLKILGIDERPLYGMREFEVYDPDGYKLVFAEDIKKE